MKAPRPTSILSPARTVCVVTLFCAAIILTFFAVSSGSASPKSFSENAAANNGKRAPEASTKGNGHGHGSKLAWLKIMAFTDAPVVGADVRVSVDGSNGRPLVEARAATNSQGAYAVQVRTEPSHLRVSISGGTVNGHPFPGHLSADVDLTDPAHQIVVVNPVTTLVSLVLDERRNLKLDDAEALVRRFLKLPPDYSLGLALRKGARYQSRFFSPLTLLAEANAAGGLDAFEHALLQELLSGSVHPFRPPNLLGDSSDPEVWVAENLASGAFSFAEGQGVGWIMSATGIPTPGASSSSIAALETALLDLASAIEDLANEVAQLNLEVKTTATQTQYTEITTTASTYATTITKQENDLQFFAQYCPPLPEGSTPTTPSQYCVDNLPLVISELQQEYTQAYYEQVESFVQDNGTLGLSGMIHLYSLWLGEARPFWRAADSTAIQNLYNYWDTILTTAANMRMELFHYLGDQNNPGGTAQITAFIGNPNLSPVLVASSSNGQNVHALSGGVLNVQSSTTGYPNSGLLLVPTSTGPQIVSYTGLGANSFTGTASSGSGTVSTGGSVTYEGVFEANEVWNQKLMFPALTSPNVFINTTDHKMWSIYPWNVTDNTCRTCTITPSATCSTTTYPVYLLSQLVLANYEGFTGWGTVPTKTDWQNLVSRAPASSSGTSWQSWLVSQTEAQDPESPISPGFYNIVTSCKINDAWTATDQTGANYNFLAGEWFVINLNVDSIPTVFEGANLVNWPQRALASGEQYYYYQ